VSAGGERVFVDCDVRQMCVEISGSFRACTRETVARAGRRRMALNERRAKQINSEGQSILRA
jgi:hypothetical protein